MAPWNISSIEPYLFSDAICVSSLVYLLRCVSPSLLHHQPSSCKSGERKADEVDRAGAEAAGGRQFVAGIIDNSQRVRICLLFVAYAVSTLRKAAVTLVIGNAGASYRDFNWLCEKDISRRS